MQDHKVGGEVLAFCTKCQLKLNHIIVAMKGANTIAKVQCLTCKSQHSFKESAMKAVKKKATSGTSAKKSSQTVSEQWMTEMTNCKKKSQPYSIKTRFTVGDVIDHENFGPGIVQSVSNDKMEVIFQHNFKTLVHNRL